jgi:AcrR family transcriptional regulator
MALQAERSAATKERLLDATVRCVIERGYRATSLPEVCRRAGVSRGAQLHHYKTKQELVAAAVEHLLSQRLVELELRLRQTAGGVLDLSDAASRIWAVYTGDTFYAWLELTVAARTEPALRALVAGLDARFVERAERMCGALLLPHVTEPREIAATTRLILAIFDGLATHRILTGDDTLPRDALRAAARAGLFAPKDRRA